MCRQIYTHPYVCTHIVLIKWVLNLPQQSWVCRAAGLEAASLVPLQRGATDTAPRRHTQPPGDLEPCASAVSLALSCAAQAGLKSLFLTGSRAPCLQALPGGWHIIPPCTGALGQPLGSRGIVALTLVVWGLNPYIVRVSELLQDKLQM